MKSWIVAVLCLSLVGHAAAQVPGVVTFQGRVRSQEIPFTGTGQFRFALVQPGPLNSVTTLWSQDGNDVPTSIVSVPIQAGLFTVALGDTNVLGMELPIPPAVFDSPDVHLRIWFNDGTSGFELLKPDQRLTSVGYSMRADNVPDGAITGAKIANGSIGPHKIGDGAITSPKLAGGAVTALQLADGSVTTEKVAANAITGSKVAPNSLTSDDIAETLRLRDLQIESEGGLDRVHLTEENNSGALYLLHGTIGKFLEASGTTDGGFLRLYDAFGGLGLAQTTVELGSSSVGGYGRFLQDNQGTGVIIQGQSGATAGGAILVYQETGLGLTLQGSTGQGQGSLINLYNGPGNRTIVLDGDASGRGGSLALYKGAGGNPTILLDADKNGEGRITTQVLEITGGSDLSETFEIQSPDAKPGMIVSIDPAHPGELAVSTRPYDRTVAGVVSGAGGVNPGMLMGQRGSRADGRYPVALTGRVYCLVDASQGAVAPGDLITTSSVPGHGMKVADPAQAHGAIIGKAMTGLNQGRGLVLLLVSLQ